MTDKLTGSFEDLFARVPDKASQVPTEIPQNIGRYRVERVLGEGGFGVVYLGNDLQLNRSVAIKVPHAKLITDSHHVESYLREAQLVAGLDHPNIVPVYDIGTTEEHPCFVVSKFIEGMTLHEQMQAERFSVRRACEIVEQLANGLHYAHREGVVHRDIKPGNILIDSKGKPFVVDFGLALQDVHLGQGPQFAGTPRYMSPEQARGEGHRVDGRSDIFSLGVVFYLMLTGNKPFRAESMNELMDQIVSHEPRPIRQFDETIPKEVERICSKAMAKRASERYSTAHDMAEDLSILLEASGPSSDIASSVASSIASSEFENDTVSETQGLQDSVGGNDPSMILGHKILPKGLRSFDSRDSEFFLELLPGPRDRMGLPNSLRFWKSRVEERDGDKTFSVGLIYGPSGCGKSSLVRAGLIPLLSEDVVCVHLEATPNETESRLLNNIRKVAVGFDNLNLKQALTAIRQGHGVPLGKKVLIVLDQFEQWLHQSRSDRCELVDALRQCDGARLQCIMMVRDDFWMAATRIMRALEIRLVEGENSAAVDLFHTRHAENVLAAFGRSYGAIEGPGTKENREFIKQAVEGISEDNKVICVRLSLLAEMMKNKPWTPAELNRLGGTRGIGVAFLEETFSVNSAPPEHRYHQKAARAVLSALLPELGTEIKGQMKSYEELMAASGYSRRPDDFADLMHLLDRVVRLITPTDPHDLEESGAADKQKNHYQLTHDYLVPSLREWLTNKQMETRAGRAEIRLAEQASLWNSKSVTRNLPTLGEFLSFRSLTDSQKYNDAQSRMMRAAATWHGRRAAVLFAVATALLLSGVFLFQSFKANQRQQAVQNQLQFLLKADTESFESELEKLRFIGGDSDESLTETFESDSNPRAKLNAALALVETDNDNVTRFLNNQLLVATTDQFHAIIRQLQKTDKIDLKGLETIAADTEESSSRRFRAACAVAAIDSNSEIWQDPKFCKFVVEYLVAVEPTELAEWQSNLIKVRDYLIPDLNWVFSDQARPSQARVFATTVLAEFLQEEPRQLFSLLTQSTPDQYPALFTRLKNFRPETISFCSQALSRDVETRVDDVVRFEQIATEKANAIATLLKLEKPQAAWTFIRKSKNTTCETFLVDRIKPLAIQPGVFLDQLNVEQDEWTQRFLISCLGEFQWDQISPQRKSEATRLLESIAASSNSNAATHSFVSWLSKQWNMPDSGVAPPPASEEPLSWTRNRLGHKLVTLDINDFQMGSPVQERDRDEDENLHTRKVQRVIAVMANEITVADWRKFCEAHPEVVNVDSNLKLRNRFTSDDSAMVGVTWFEAAQFCNWLSEQDGIPKDQWCYKPTDDGKFELGMSVSSEMLNLKGYRLPTESEWEFACRGGQQTARHFGTSDNQLERFVWFRGNNNGQSRPVGLLRPNQYGLFDMLGNGWEWCHDPFRGPYTSSPNAVLEDEVPVKTIDSTARILRGGGMESRPEDVRSANRFSGPPNEALNYDVGFRPVRTIRISGN